MLNRIFCRSASRKAFTLPPIKFRHATQSQLTEKGNEREHIPISSPVKPIQESSKNVIMDELMDKQTPRTSRYKGNSLKNTTDNKENYSSRYTQGRAYQRKLYRYKPTGELIYGIYPVQLALDAQRRTFHHLMYKKGCERRNEKIQEIINVAISRGIKASSLTSTEFKKVLMGDQVHQGICCDVSPLPFQILQTDEFSVAKRDTDSSKVIRNECDKETNDTANTTEYRKISKEDILIADQTSLGNGEQIKCQKLNIHQEGRTKQSLENEREMVYNGNRFLSKQFDYRQRTIKGKLLVAEDFSKVTESTREGKIHQLWIYLDQIKDPMNFGAVLRSAYFFGVDKVLTSDRNSCTLNGVVSKASAGVAEVLPVYALPYPPTPYLTRLTAAGWVLAATAHQDTSQSLTPVQQFIPKANTLLVIGNEGSGVHEDIIKLSSVVLTVPPTYPLHPAANCLNVSAATAVLLHTLTINLRHHKQVN